MGISHNEPENVAGLNAALDMMWARFLPQVRERAEVLASAAQAAMAGHLTGEQREAAQSAAHKLAGTLGTFGLDRGTELAREIENSYAAGVDHESATLIGATTAEIKTIIESRGFGG